MRKMILGADFEAALDIPFLLYGASSLVAWPQIGSAVKVAGYVGGSDKSSNREDFARNEKGEYGTSVEISDAKTGRSYGKDTVLEKPGAARGQPLVFSGQIEVPEGATVTYTLTRRLRYEGGFEPVLLSLSDDLAPSK